METTTKAQTSTKCCLHWLGKLNFIYWWRSLVYILWGHKVLKRTFARHMRDHDVPPMRSIWSHDSTTKILWCTITPFARHMRDHDVPPWEASSCMIQLQRFYGAISRLYGECRSCSQVKKIHQSTCQPLGEKGWVKRCKHSMKMRCGTSSCPYHIRRSSVIDESTK